jgi:hypothetical protein
VTAVFWLLVGGLLVAAIATDYGNEEGDDDEE